VEMALDSTKTLVEFFPAIGSIGKKDESGSNPNCRISEE
jgi:hypothetical protein